MAATTTQPVATTSTTKTQFRVTTRASITMAATTTQPVATTSTTKTQIRVTTRP